MVRCLCVLFFSFFIVVSVSYGQLLRLKRSNPKNTPDNVQTTTSAIWAKKAQQGFSMKVWISNQLSMGIEAWDPLPLPATGSCVIGLGLEYPIGSCVEHLFGAGPIIGAVVNGTPRVSISGTPETNFIPLKKDTSGDRIWYTSTFLSGKPNKRLYDDDGDGKIDEDELDGLDNDGDWNALTDDIGADGVPDSMETGCKGSYDPVTNHDPVNDNYEPTIHDSCHSDISGNFPFKNNKDIYTEKNGVPDHGEPHVDEDYAAFSNKDLSTGVTDTLNSPQYFGHIPLGAKIWQKTYSWQTGVASGPIFFLEYNFIDVGNVTWQKPYFGMFADMDVGSVWNSLYFKRNYAAYDSATHTAYIQNPVDTGSTPLGITLLGASRPLDSLKFIFQWGQTSSLAGTDSTIYHIMNGDALGGQFIKRNQSPDSLNDAYFILTFGPFSTIQPGDFGRATFAFVSGSTVNEMLLNAQKAKAFYDNNYTTDVPNQKQTIPSSFSLSQNYPNPFNPVTQLQFAISKLQMVTLKVYDVLGREVSTLVNEQKQPGVYTVNWDAGKFSSGVYFYELTAGNFREIKKMILMR